MKGISNLVPRSSSRPGVLGLLALGLLLPACGPSRMTVLPDRAYARAERQAPEDRGYDVEHYRIDLQLFPRLREIEGRCTIRLAARRGLDEVELDLVGLTVDSVEDDLGDPLPFEQEGELLTVELGARLERSETAELTVRYGGRPVTGLWFSGSDAEGHPNQVFTHGQPRESRGWFPCFDDPSDRATTEVRVTMPESWVSVAPGRRVDASTGGTDSDGEPTRTEHWRMETPHPSYLTSLVAGRLVQREDSWQGTPLVYLSEARYADWLEASFNETDDVLAFLEEYTGIRYPYPKYSQAVVANFPWGGMENISATTLTPLTLDDERGRRDEQSHRLVAHEAAHQWFGDLLTCNDWSHLWLNEGFATYMTELYFEQTRGIDEFRARMRNAQDAYVQADRGPERRPTVHAVYKEPGDLFGAHVYGGAAARLHLLRHLLGDETFRAGIRTYVAENAGRNVVTEDFQRAMEKVSGEELDVFFEQWIYGRGYPEFELEWDWDARRNLVELSVRQTQASLDGTPSAFRVPVEVEVRDSRGTVVHEVELRRRNESFELPAHDRPSYVRFDKHGWIPKTVEWVRRSRGEWLAIATTDDDVNGRRDAVAALGEEAAEQRIPSPQAHEVCVAELCNRLRRDRSRWVRRDAATALGRAGGLEARERLVQASGEDPEAMVRKAALDALGNFGPSDDLAELAIQRFEEGYSWETMGAAAGLLCKADPDGAYSWLADKLFVESPHDQLCRLLLKHLGSLDDPGVSEQLLRWARDDSVHPTARAAALEELAKRPGAAARFSRDVVPFLDVESFRLRRAAVEALAEMADPVALDALRAYYPHARTSGERRVIEGVVRIRR